MIEEHQSKRRAFLWNVCVSSVVTVSGCIDLGNPQNTEDDSFTTTNVSSESEGSTTQETKTTTSTEIKSCPTPDSTPEVLVDDLIVQNTDDVDHTVSITIGRNSTTVFDDSFSVAASGGGKEFTTSIFDTKGTYNLHVIVENGSTEQTNTEFEATKTISVDDDNWRRHNGAMVSIRSPKEVDISILHADPTPTRTSCSN